MRAESMIVPCGYCDGEGRVYRGHPNDPEPRSARCPVCGGKGLEEVACEPGGRDDDLDEREARAPRSRRKERAPTLLFPWSKMSLVE